MYDEYASKGFEILAFPSNQFGGQEPGTNEEIKSFVRDKYKARFPLFDKVDVNGANAVPLYKDLLRASFPGDIAWNFEKFLVDRNGVPVARYPPGFPPDDILPDILPLLGAE
eukprot:tig00000178_g12726.t1